MASHVSLPSARAEIDGWTLRRVVLDSSGCDRWGWRWGLGERLWHLSDGADSLSIRSPSPVAAIALVATEAWPPKLLRRYNWEYASP